MWKIKEGRKGRKTGREKAWIKVEKRKQEKTQRGREKEDGKKEEISEQRGKSIRENQKGKKGETIHKEKVE